MNFVKSFIRMLVAYFLTTFYSCVVAVTLIIRFIVRPSKIWEVKSRDVPPKCIQHPEDCIHGYVQLDDVKIHYVEAGDRNNPLMLFIHGFPEFWFSWRHQLKEFKNDYWVVAIDMRGYGDSSKPEGRDAYQVKYLVDDIFQFLTKMGKEKCILVAHDWGGLVGWTFVNKYPDLIEKYIMMNTSPPSILQSLIRSDWEQFKMSWYMFFFQMPYLPEFAIRTNDLAIFKVMFKKTEADEVVEAYKYTFGKPGALTPPLNYYRNLFRFRSVSSDVKKPQVDNEPKGLFIFGDKDTALKSKIAFIAKDYYKNLKVEFIYGASHFVQQDAPEKVNESMRTFLAE